MLLGPTSLGRGGIISNARISIDSADFRRQLSDAPEAEWSRHQARAVNTAKKRPAAKPGDAQQVLAVWSESAAFGWLTWGISSTTDGQKRAPDLVAIGIVDKSWAKGRVRSQSAMAHAERRRRIPGRPGWWNARLALAVVIAFIFIGITTNAGATTSWPVSVGLVLGVMIYNFPAIARRFSRRHVRVFADAALVTTRDDLYALLSPVSAIARTGRALRTATVSPADHELIDDALAEALKAVWQATDPASTRAEVTAVKD